MEQESDIKRQLSAKIEVAKFLQEALAKRATALQQQQEELIEEFSDFEQKVQLLFLLFVAFVRKS
jgi:hypothetical protein